MTDHTVDQFDMLADESTDISVTKQLGLSILYISKKTKKFVATFLTLQSLERGDAEGITKAILDVLESFKLEPLKMRGLGADNASVMTGKFEKQP